MEFALDVLRQWVYLQRQVLAVHGVQHIETDGEFLAEPGVYPVTQKIHRLGKHQIHCGGLHQGTTKIQQQAVFFGNAVEAPGVVAPVFRQVKITFHPVPAPDTGVKVENKPEGLQRRLPERFPVGISQSHGENIRGGHVQVEVKFWKQLFLHPVGPAPFGKVASLVFFPLGQVFLGGVPVGHPTAVAQLDFPAGDVRVEEQVSRIYQTGPNAVHQHQSGRNRINLFLCGGQILPGEEILQIVGGHDAEDGIIGQFPLNQSIQRFRGDGQSIAVEHQCRMERGEASWSTPG